MKTDDKKLISFFYCSSKPVGHLSRFHDDDDGYRRTSFEKKIYALLRRSHGMKLKLK